MNNSTGTGFDLYDYASYDIDLINLISGSVNMLTTIYIMWKVGNWGICFKTIRNKQRELQRKREKKELQKVKRLMESIQSGNIVDIDELLSEEEEEEYEVNNKGVLKIAHKKKKPVESKV